MKFHISLFLILLLLIGCEKKSTNGDGNGNGDKQEECLIEEQFASIQDDIDAASDGDTVLIDPGTHTGSINFQGKNIVVGSLFLTTGDTSYMRSTIIDANGHGSVVRFENDEGPGAVLAGLTLTGGSAYEGGGIYINGASPTLHHLIITGNEVTTCTEGQTTITAAGGGVYMNASEASFNIAWIEGNKSEVAGGGIFMQSSDPSFRSVSVNADTASDGGAFYMKSSSPEMVRMIIMNNVADNGAGLFLSLSYPTLENILIAQNVAEVDGGGLYLINAGPEATNMVVADNEAVQGGGVFLSSSGFDIMNAIMYNDDPQEIYFGSTGGESSVTINYSNVEGGLDGIVTNDNGSPSWGEGNISADPVFGDGCAVDIWAIHVGDDFSLGLYTLEGPGGIPIEGSPSIDSGNPSSSYNDNDGTQNNMGWMGGPNGCDGGD